MAHVERLEDLPDRKVRSFLRKLRLAGITPERFLMMLGSDQLTEREIEAVWPNVPPQMSPRRTGFLYDAKSVGKILGLTCSSTLPVPDLQEDEIIVFYDGWTPDDLSSSLFGKRRMFHPSNAAGKLWKAQPGYYRVRPRYKPWPHPKSQEDIARFIMYQMKDLREFDISPPWKPAPLSVLATALLVHAIRTGHSIERDHCLCLQTEGDDWGAGIFCLTTIHGKIEFFPQCGEGGRGRNRQRGWLAAAQLIQAA